MDLDNIHDPRGGGRSRGHYGSHLSSLYSRRWSDAYQSVRDPSPVRQYFNSSPPQSQPPPRRNAMPPPPPPPPQRSNSEKKKSRQHRHSRSRRTTPPTPTADTATGTETKSVSTSSSADDSTTTGSVSHDSSSSTFSRSGSSAARSSKDRPTTSTGSSSASSITTTTSSSSSSRRRYSHGKRRERRKKVQMRANEFSRVAAIPSTAAQDEKIAAAAACKAILDRELELKEKELRLIRQKRNFAAEIQRRSALLHRFGSEDDAIRQLQRLVDMEDTTPALEEYLRRTSKDLPVSGSSTDAGALAFLRSCERGLSGESVVQMLHRIAAPPSLPSALDASAASVAIAHKGEPDVARDAHVASKVASDESPGRTPSVLAAPIAGEGIEAHQSSSEVASLLEHSLPAEGHSLIHPSTPTPARSASLHSLSAKTASQAFTTTARVTDEAVVVNVSTGARNSSVAPSSDMIEKTAQLASGKPAKGDNAELKTRSHHNGSRILSHKSEAKEEADLPSTGPIQPERQQQLLPPPPSPAYDTAATQQIISVDPLQRYNQGRPTQQPWATSRVSCPTSSGPLTQEGKDAPPEIWYATNSPVPLSHREFKALLCSEYVSAGAPRVIDPESRDTVVAGVDVDKQVSSAPQGGTKEGRHAYEPFGGAASNAHHGAPSPPRLIQNANEVGSFFSTEKSAQVKPDSLGNRLVELSAPPPVSLGADEDGLIVEFPPPPRTMIDDMPPPGDVGRKEKNRCCGFGCGCGKYSGCRCWSAIFRCFFPCCYSDKREH